MCRERETLFEIALLSDETFMQSIFRWPIDRIMCRECETLFEIAPLSDEMFMQSIFRWPIDRIMCRERETLFEIAPLSDETLMQSIFRWPIDRIMCHERETLFEIEIFQPMERHYSWDSILISIFRIDTHDLKDGNVHTRKAMKKTCCVRVWIQL